MVPVVRELELDIRAGEVVALVGESGSGKSVTGMAINGLISNRDPRQSVTGTITFRRRDGSSQNLADLDDERLRAIRGNEIGMVFQEPMTALNPVMKVKDQIAEVVLEHQHGSRPRAYDRALEMLTKVGISEPGRRMDAFPHHLSGGMRQRIMIAMALVCDPVLLIADEPTTALDVTIQAQILTLLRDMKDELGTAVLLITHDLGVVAENADRIVVMYAGAVMEEGPTADVLKSPNHPYTRALMRSIPHYRARGQKLQSISGSVPAPGHLPPGCVFHPRCQHARAGLCDVSEPSLEDVVSGHSVRCVRWRELVGSDA
jgi:oligopeptide transport system ATP-binding protein